MILQGNVGQSTSASFGAGSPQSLRLGNMGDSIVSELHGRFYEAAYRNSLFRTATTAAVALTNANQTTANGFSATLATAAAATPILGVWNPLTSTVNLVILQASLQAFISSYAATTPFGPLVWGMSNGNSAISTGLVPWSSKTGTQIGSQAKGFAGATALTGLTNVFNTTTGIETADFSIGISPVTAAYGTLASGTVPLSGIASQTQNFDGQLIVPPGAVLALYTTTVGVNVGYTGRLLWEEVPV
jgi:hypothetical protein